MKIALFFLFFISSLHVDAQKKSLDARVIDIENAIYAGFLEEAKDLTKELSKGSDLHAKQWVNLLYAKIAYQKGDLKLMNSYLPRIKDDFADVRYYKEILYGQYLILNNKTALGLRSLEKAILENYQTTNPRIHFDILNTKLFIFAKNKELDNKTEYTGDVLRNAFQIFEQLSQAESDMELFEKSRYLVSQAAFVSSTDTVSFIQIGNKLREFGKKHSFNSSLILGTQILSDYQKSPEKKLAFLREAYNYTEKSQLPVLNSNVYFSYMTYFKEKGELDSAIYWGQKSIYPDNIDLSIYLDPYDRISQLYVLKGDYKTALEYKNLDAKKHKEISLKHSNGIREYLIGGLEKNLQEKNELIERNRLLIIGISIFAGFLLLLLYYVLSLHKKLKKAVVEIQQTNTQIELFSQILSHDLKAPLFSISKLIGYVMEDEKTMDFKSKSYLVAAKDACDNSNLLINNIMTFIRHKDVPVTFATTSFPKILSTVKQNLKDQIEINNVQINAFETPESLLVNETLFIQLLQNLIQNSIKYRQIELDPIIDIYYKAKGNGFELIIADNGKGIPAHKTESLLKAFEQDASASINQGIGLGLAICSVIVKAHNGTIKLENNTSDGIRVIMTFQPE